MSIEMNDGTYIVTGGDIREAKIRKLQIQLASNPADIEARQNLEKLLRIEAAMPSFNTLVRLHTAEVMKKTNSDE